MSLFPRLIAQEAGKEYGGRVRFLAPEENLRPRGRNLVHAYATLAQVPALTLPLFTQVPRRRKILGTPPQIATAKQHQIYDIWGMCPSRISYYTKRRRSGGEREVVMRVVGCYG
jgi:hypothetical protein